MDSLANLIRQIRRSADMTQTEFAKALDVTQPSVSRWESGGEPDTDSIAKLAKFSGKPIEAFYDLLDRSGSESGGLRVSEPEASSGPTTNPKPYIEPQIVSDIPILGGTAVGNANYSIASQTRIGFAVRPRGLANTTGVYALYVTDSSMNQRFEEGSKVYVSSLIPAAIGDHIVIEQHPVSGETFSRRYLRRLIGRTETQYVCAQYNPALEDRFPLASVKWIHRIFPLDELI